MLKIQSDKHIYNYNKKENPVYSVMPLCILFLIFSWKTYVETLIDMIDGLDHFW